MSNEKHISIDRAQYDLQTAELDRLRLVEAAAREFIAKVDRKFSPLDAYDFRATMLGLLKKVGGGE